MAVLPGRRHRPCLPAPVGRRFRQPGYGLKCPPVRRTVFYRAQPRAPVIEIYTTIESLASSTAIAASDLNVFQLSVAKGEVTWLTGPEADPTTLEGSFTLHRQSIATGGRLELGAEGRFTERAVPHFLVDRLVAGGGEGTRTETFFGGLMWSGAWALAVEPSGTRLRATLGLATHPS